RAQLCQVLFNAWHGACCIWPARDELSGRVFCPPYRSPSSRRLGSLLSINISWNNHILARDMVRFGIAQAVWREGDQCLLLGQGRYLDDISLPGQCYGARTPTPASSARRRQAQSRARACFACSPAPTRWRRGSAASLAAAKLFCARGASKAQTLPLILDNREKIPHNGGGCAATAFPLEDGWTARHPMRWEQTNGTWQLERRSRARPRNR